MALTKDQARSALVGARLVIGAATWLLPNRTARLLLIDPEANPALPVAMRLFGVRDALLGVTVLLLQGAPQQRFLQLNPLVDLADATAFAAAGLARQISPPASLLSTTICLAGAAVGAAARGYGPLAAERA